MTDLALTESMMEVEAMELGAANDAVQMTELGAVILRDLTYDEVLRHALTSKRVGNVVTWYLWDMIDYLRNKDEQLVPQLAADLGMSEGSVNNALYVTAWWRYEYRVPDASPTLHKVLTPLVRSATVNNRPEDLQIAQDWLHAAVENRWSKRDLEEEMRMYALPPGYEGREQILPPGTQEADVEELVINAPRITINDMRNCLSDMTRWAERNGAPEGLLNEARRCLNGVGE